jgi:hypothetical protein
MTEKEIVKILDKYTKLTKENVKDNIHFFSQQNKKILEIEKEDKYKKQLNGIKKIFDKISLQLFLYPDISDIYDKDGNPRLYEDTLTKIYNRMIDTLQLEDFLVELNKSAEYYKMLIHINNGLEYKEDKKATEINNFKYFLYQDMVFYLDPLKEWLEENEPKKSKSFIKYEKDSYEEQGVGEHLGYYDYKAIYNAFALRLLNVRIEINKTVEKLVEEFIEDPKLKETILEAFPLIEKEETHLLTKITTTISKQLIECFNKNIVNGDFDYYEIR